MKSAMVQAICSPEIDIPGTLLAYLPGVSKSGRVGIAVCHDKRRVVYSLRHTAYKSREYIDEQPDQLFRDSYDAHNNIFSLYAVIDDQPVASIRCCVHDPRHAPCDIPAFSVYPETKARFAGLKILELNRFVISPNVDNHSRAYAVLILRYGIQVGKILGVKRVLAAVRERHTSFYKRFANMSLLCGPSYYPGLKFSTVLMGCDFEENYPLTLKHPMLPWTREEEASFYQVVNGVYRKG
ncbi:hypothetical protein CCP2SC5_330026 [Azospirillaceae bacterium]